jgi:drug/metabolite transporter (DMT)-like permease
MADIQAPTGSVAPASIAPASTGFGPVWLILLAMVAFSTQDVVVKIVAEQVSLWQLQFIRSLLTLWLLVMMVAAMGRMPTLAPKAWFWPLVRASFMCGAYLTFYASLPLLPLSKAAASFFTGPLIITVLAALLLGEPTGPRRIFAVIVGFAGVLLIIQPGMEGWKPIAFLPVLSAFFYAIGVVIPRWRCQDEPNFALSMVHNLLYAGIGLLGIVALELVPVAPGTQADWPFLTTSWMNLGALAGGSDPVHGGDPSGWHIVQCAGLPIGRRQPDRAVRVQLPGDHASLRHSDLGPLARTADPAWHDPDLWRRHIRRPARRASAPATSASAWRRPVDTRRGKC